VASNMVLFGWKRSLPGREQMSATHFQDFVAYLEGLQQSGAIGSWDSAFLNAHGGDLNGFFLIRGDPDQISSLIASDEWVNHMLRAGLHLDQPGAVTGAIGDLVNQRFAMWSSMIPA
jgi:hypothetical protein